MATIRAAKQPQPSAIGCRYWLETSRPRAPAMRAWWPAPEFAQTAQPAPERWVERLRVFVLQAPPSSAAQARAMPITASPALGSPRKSLQNVTHSYFGPAAEEIAIEP